MGLFICKSIVLYRVNKIEVPIQSILKNNSKFQIDLI